MRLISCAASLALILCATSARAEDEEGHGYRHHHHHHTHHQVNEVWQVSEGANGLVTGVWNVTWEGRSFSGNARMAKANGTPLTYLVAGEIKSGHLLLQRVKPSDQTVCQYIAAGRARNNRIEGTTLCNGNSTIWRVVITPRTAQN